MEPEPTEDEIEHAISMLQEVPSWVGPMAIIPIDPVCLWEIEDEEPCEEPLEFVSVLLQEESDGNYTADAVVLCEYHMECLKAGLDRWRTLS